MSICWSMNCVNIRMYGATIKKIVPLMRWLKLDILQSCIYSVFEAGRLLPQSQTFRLILKLILSKWWKDEKWIESINDRLEWRIFVALNSREISGVCLHRAVTCPLPSMLSHAHYSPADAWRFNWHIENKKLFLIFEHMFTLLFFFKMSNFTNVLGNVSLTYVIKISWGLLCICVWFQ